METIENGRRTGKTSRMMEEARQLAREGRAVYVIFHNNAYAQQMRNEEDEALGIKFESTESIGYFDWERLRVRGAHHNCSFLVDHYTIESRYGPVLNMLHRWD